MERPLVAALARAQASFGPLLKAHTNPHYKSKYADLGDVLAVVRPALNAEGIAVTQAIETTGPVTVLATHLLFADGDRISSSVPLDMGGKPQEIGSALSYLRRYALAALVGVAPEDDDDGNTAGERQVRPVRERPVTTVPVDERRAQAGAWADALTDARAESWADWKHAHTGWHRTASGTFAEAWELLRDLYALEQSAGEAEPFADEHPAVPSSKQMKRLFAAMKTAGIGDDIRHEWAAGWLLRPVTTFADLTVDEWEMLVAQADAEGTTE